MAGCCGRCFCCKCCCAEAETQTPEELTILGEFQTEEEILPRKDYESLDYDRCINEPYVELLEGITPEKVRGLEAVRWVLVFTIGVTVGLVGVFVDFFVHIFTKFKLDVVGAYLQSCSDASCLLLSGLQLVAFNLSFVFLASALVLMQPVAAGSGIPEIKSYLNGVKIPGIVRLRTLVCKVLGVILSVAGGLFVGKEGPMIHSGAIVGAGLPQFQSITFKWIHMDFPYFRSDRDKRDFVSAGAAAGVAAAFGAPIGGTLFSLEEGSSFWNQALTWKVLFCSMSATFTLNFFRSGLYFNKWGSFQLPGLLNFGEFKCADGDKRCHLWTAVDLAFFVLMGVVGGLMGALFNCMNKCLAKYRLKRIHNKARLVRVLESLLVSLVTTLLIFASSYFVGECLQLPHHNTTGGDGSSSVRHFFCPNNTYNDMATLLFNPQEKAIHQLFHQDGLFSPLSLSLFLVLYLLLSCWTYGVSVPSGLFVPCLLCGAASGRLVANVLNQLWCGCVVQPPPRRPLNRKSLENERRRGQEDLRKARCDGVLWGRSGDRSRLRDKEKLYQFQSNDSTKSIPGDSTLLRRSSPERRSRSGLRWGLQLTFRHCQAGQRDSQGRSCGPGPSRLGAGPRTTEALTAHAPTLRLPSPCTMLRL
uniref:Uncharacterized protein n=1 Tax=Knipowitschia caucasica TaxID=637954 RepID=A0AAV2M1T4_KNICA